MKSLSWSDVIARPIPRAGGRSTKAWFELRDLFLGKKIALRGRKNVGACQKKWRLVAVGRTKEKQATCGRSAADGYTLSSTLDGAAHARLSTVSQRQCEEHREAES
jgi:hypothetical protein